MPLIDAVHFTTSSTAFSLLPKVQSHAQPICSGAHPESVIFRQQKAGMQDSNTAASETGGCSFVRFVPS
jgi:hypothetical protein